MPGIRQRLAQADELELASKPEEPASELALRLLQRVLWGEISPQLARLLAEDGCANLIAKGAEPPKELAQLAGIGAKGNQPSNCWRDLLAILKEPLLSEPSGITIPVKDSSVRGWKPDELAVMGPHIVFHELFQNVEAWREKLLPDRSILEPFWQDQVIRSAPRLENSPMLEVDNWKSLFVPLWIHGDGAPVTGVGKSWGKSMDSWIFGSLLARGQTKSVSFLIMAIFLATQVSGVGFPHGGTVKLAFSLFHVFVLLLHQRDPCTPRFFRPYNLHEGSELSSDWPGPSLHCFMENFHCSMICGIHGLQAALTK